MGHGYAAPGRLRDSIDVEQRGEEHSDLDGDSQIGEHGESEGHHPHGYVRFRQPEYGSYLTPFTHVVGHHEKNRSECSQRNETRAGAATRLCLINADLPSFASKIILTDSIVRSPLGESL